MATAKKQNIAPERTSRVASTRWIDTHRGRRSRRWKAKRSIVSAAATRGGPTTAAPTRTGRLAPRAAPITTAARLITPPAAPHALFTQPVWSASRTRGAAPNTTASAVPTTNTPIAAVTEPADAPWTPSTCDQLTIGSVTRNAPTKTAATRTNAADALEIARRMAPRSSRPFAAATSLSSPFPSPRSAKPSRPDAVIKSSQTPNPSGGRAAATKRAPTSRMARLGDFGAIALAVVTANASMTVTGAGEREIGVSLRDL